MSEIALVTAGIGLCLSIVALWLERAASIRSERVAADLDKTHMVALGCVEEIAKVTTELPESRVIAMEGTCNALKQQYDLVVNEFEKHRGQCHRTMQRFDQIMRRDERAAKVITDAQETNGDGLDTETADDGDEAIPTQEGDRSFLETPDRSPAEVATILRDRNPTSSWDERRRAMSREYHANRGGVPSGPRR